MYIIQKLQCTYYLLKLALCANEVVAIQEANIRPVIKEFWIGKWFNAAGKW